MEYINKVLLKGRIGKAPVLRYMPSGDAVINFSVATKHGQLVEWHPVVGYKDVAERANKEFGQGDTVFIEGRIQTREMQTAEDKHTGRKRLIRELISTSMHLVEKSKKAGTADDAPLSPGEESQTDDVPPESPNDGIPSYI